MTHGSLFSGIGGFDLAASWMGWENVFHCENNEFCQKVLKYHFPNSIQHGDIKTTDFSVYRGKVDIVTGGFPCQPYSMAGKRKGTADDRHLWPEMLRAIIEIQPRWVVGENVPGLLNWKRGMVLAEIKADLEAAGFEVFPPAILPACGKNAPHKRERLWIVAYNTASGEFNKGKIKEFFGKEQSTDPTRICTENVAYADSKRINGRQEVNADKGGFDALNDFGENDESGTIADTGLQRQKIGKEQAARIGQQDKGNVSNTEQSGLERAVGTQKSKGLKSGHKEHDAANTNSNKRCEGGLHKTKQKETKRYIGTFNTREDERQTWNNFPTQSPLCGGDDGLSRKLDGITFPKWRNESIKALGNAVVSELVLEIFKAIEQIEKT